MDVSPLNYKLTFEPDLQKFIFHGLESISINCKKPTNIITMNCAELKIKILHCKIWSENYRIHS